jgi:hypothetical protein
LQGRSKVGLILPFEGLNACVLSTGMALFVQNQNYAKQVEGLQRALDVQRLIDLFKNKKIGQVEASIVEN